MAKKSRYVAVGLVFMLALSVLLTGGEAKAEDPWIEITSKSQLEDIHTNLSGKFRLMCDIDLNDTTWTPIGSVTDPFIGELDGNGKTVKNFSINNTSTANQGLFAVIGNGGSVSHLAIENATVTAGNYTGILAGVNNGSIKLCSAKGTVTGANYVGGLVGSNDASGSILNSYAAAYVSGKDYVGGLVGTNAGSLEKTYAASQIKASLFNNYIQFTNGRINIPNISAYATASFTLEAWFQWDQVGTDSIDFILSKGVVGNLGWFELHTGGGSGVNGVRFIPIYQKDTAPGKFDSWLDVQNVMQPGWFHIAAVYDYDSNTQKASGRIYLNGIAQTIWQFDTNGTVSSPVGTIAYMSRATNPLSGNTNPLTIGMRGDGTFPFHGKISDVRIWNKARTQEEIIADKNKQLSGNEPGLVGYWKLDEASGTVAYDSTANGNAGTLVGAVSRVKETAAAHQGGLAGDNTGTISASYYDADVSGQSDAKGIPTTTDNMKKAETFAGWNFDHIWGWANNYPYLREVNFTLGAQVGKLVKGTAGSATFSLATADVPDGLHAPVFSWFTDADGSAGATSPNGVTPSLGSVSSNSATVTMVTASEAANGTYYFNVATNGMVSGIQTLTIVNPSYIVTFDAEGGTVSPGSQEKLYGSTYGKAADGTTPEVLPTPSKAGYTFGGWWTEDNGTGSQVTDTTMVTTVTAHTLYAKWEANTYTVQYDANGGAGTTAPSSHTYDALQALTGSGFTRTGYHFAGWAASEDGPAVYTDGQNVQNLTAADETTVMLYAKWEANTYTVQYDANGGAGTTAQSSYTYDALQALTGSGFTRTGYHFAGWAESADGPAVYTDGQNVQNLTTTDATTVTLYAKWEANTYTVQYDANGGAGTTAPSSHTYGALQALTGSGFTRTGYHFAGWAENADGPAVYTDGQNVQNLTAADSATVMLYAKWEANTCEVVEVPGSIPNADLVVVESVGDALTQSVEIRIQDSAEAEEAIQAALESDAGLAGITPAHIFPLDISMYIKGTNTRVQLEEGEAVLITCPIPPELLAGKDSLVVVCVESGKLIILPTQIVTVNGIYCVQFTATHFSPYAIVVNSKGASGDRKATVITGTVSDITCSDATLTGIVRSIGSAAVTERGFVIGTMPDPVLGGEGVTKITLPGGKGSFSAKVEKLLPAMTYYVRAYAINSAGVSYGKSMPLCTGYVGDGKAAIPKTGDNVDTVPLLLFGLAIATAGTMQALRRKRRAGRS